VYSCYYAAISANSWLERRIDTTVPTGVGLSSTSTIDAMLKALVLPFQI